MNKKFENNEQLNRMKSLMSYGLKTEGKDTPYSSIEYQKLGADGKAYAIIREGKKFYIKCSDNKANLVKEDFQYIGGFRNRKDHEYTGFANAQKNFDLKMMSLKEAYDKKDFSVNSWDLDKKENVVIEATDKMQKEILRERQIMKNAMVIAEKKGAVCCDEPECPKDNIKCEKPQTGNPNKAAGYKKAKLPKEMTNGTVNEEEVLGWNRGNDNYLDKSHGTEIGDSAPFDDATARNIDSADKKVSKTGEMSNGTVEEGTSMHDSDNQNTPTPGVGNIGDNQPFDGEKGKQIDEAIDDLGDDEDALGAEGEDLGDDEMDYDDVDGDEFDDEEEEPIDGDEIGDEELDDDDDDVYEDDMESRISAMEELLSQIASRLGVEEAPVDDAAYGDDDLFGDEDGEDEFGDEDELGDEDGDYELEYDGGDEFGDEEEIDDEVDMEQMPMESRRRRGATRIYETTNFRRAMRKQRMNEDGMKPFKDGGRVPSGNMNKLSDFGGHPAYQKKVMELPTNNMQEFPEYYDMNDDSVRNENPYGEKIGDGAPFNIDPESIENAISESIMRFKKKSSRR